MAASLFKFKNLTPIQCQSTIRALERSSLHKPNSLHAFQGPLFQQIKPSSRTSCHYNLTICNPVSISRNPNPLILTKTRRVLYAWQNPGVPVEEVMSDILRVFHHPALRDEHLEIHRNMFNTVRTWVDEQPDRYNLNSILSSESVKKGYNHSTAGASARDIHDHGSLGGHGKTSGSIWSEIQARDLGAMEGTDGNPQHSYMTSSPQPGTPSHPPHSPKFGYQNIQRPGSSNYERPHSQGSHLNPNPQISYQSGQYQQDYGSSYQQQPYGMPPGPPGGYQNAPYPTEQLPYGSPGPYPDGPGGPGYAGPSGGWQGLPPGGFGGPPPGPPYSGQYPGQQPPYGGYQQYPPGGGYGGGY